MSAGEKIILVMGVTFTVVFITGLITGFVFSLMTRQRKADKPKGRP